MRSPGCDAGLVGRRPRLDAGHDRPGRVRVLRLDVDAEDAALEVGPLLEARQDGVYVLQRDGESQAGVVHLEAGRLALLVGRGRHDDADDAAAQVDERAAVVGRRNAGVGLHGLAPDAAGRADDADGHRRRVVDGVGQGAAQHQGGLADLDLGLGRRRRDRQAAFLDFEERQHARLVGGDHLGRVALLLAGDRHVDGGRLVGEVEGAGDDVAVGADDDAAGRPESVADHGAAGPAHQVGAALRLDLHHAGGDLGHGRLDGLLLEVAEVVVGPRPGASRARAARAARV